MDAAKEPILESPWLEFPDECASGANLAQSDEALAMKAKQMNSATSTDRAKKRAAVYRAAAEALMTPERSKYGSCCVVYETAHGIKKPPYAEEDLDRDQITSSYIRTFADCSSDLGWMVDQASAGVDATPKVELRILLLCMAAAIAERP